MRKAESLQRETHFFGDGMPTDSSSNHCKFLTPVDHERVGEMYATYETLVYNPRVIRPFKRTIIEALLAGCEVRYSGKSAFDSFEKSMEAIIEDCRFTSTDIFWKAITDSV